MCIYFYTLTASPEPVKSKPRLKCHNTLNNLDKETVVELYWISGHGGRRSNKIADDLARVGAEPTITGRKLAVCISYAQIRNYFQM